MAFLLLEATVCCRFYSSSKAEVIQQSHPAEHLTSVIKQLLSQWNGCNCVISTRHNRVLLLSCDNVLKFDWYSQLSGSGSISLNLLKLPGRFSYSLGTRLDPPETDSHDQTLPETDSQDQTLPETDSQDQTLPETDSRNKLSLRLIPRIKLSLRLIPRIKLSLRLIPRIKFSLRLTPRIKLSLRLIPRIKLYCS